MKKRIDYNKLPYLTTKVVKAKKQLKEPYCVPCFTDKIFCKKYCSYYIEHKLQKPQPKGNWVNGENLDKIKFPVLCRYNQNYLGILYINKDDSYGLVNINKQREKWSVEDNGWHNLENMIRAYDIHILKGKIIIFE